MKKIMIYAYTKFNLGDDLFIKVLCERYPDTSFILYAPKEYKQLFADLNNLQIIPSDSFYSRTINYILRKIGFDGGLQKKLANRSDACVNIGGSLFMHGEDWKKNLKYKKLLKVKNKPFFLLGANFGPFDDEEFYSTYKEIFKGYTDICFREKYSYNLFKDLENVRIADDVVFQLPVGDFSKTSDNNLLISLIKPSFRESLKGYDEVYYEKMKDISVYFIEKGYRVTLMSFCESEGDLEAIESVIDLIPREFYNNITKHFYKQNLNESLNLISKSKFVVATRFHAMILGWVYKKPVFPVAYSEKMTNVMDDVGFNGHFTDFNNLYQLDAQKVFQEMSKNVIDVNSQAESSKKHFAELDKYLVSSN